MRLRLLDIGGGFPARYAADEQLPDLADWWKILDGVRETYPLGWTPTEDGHLSPQLVIQKISELSGPESVYAAGVGTELPLTRAAAQAAVADQLADGGEVLDSWSAETDGAEVTVRCTRYVEIAFGWLFLGGAPLERTAIASARAPTVP